MECLDSLKILNTLTSLMTLRMARDMACCPFPCCSASSVPSVIKYGIMATISIMFMMFLEKVALEGQAKNRTSSSKENQMMHSVSTTKNGSENGEEKYGPVPLTVATGTGSLWSSLNSGNVSRQKMTMEMRMTRTEEEEDGEMRKRSSSTSPSKSEYLVIEENRELNSSAFKRQQNFPTATTATTTTTVTQNNTVNSVSINKKIFTDV